MCLGIWDAGGVTASTTVGGAVEQVSCLYGGRRRRECGAR